MVELEAVDEVVDMMVVGVVEEEVGTTAAAAVEATEVDSAAVTEAVSAVVEVALRDLRSSGKCLQTFLFV
jgi:hypothetical protein